MTRHGSPELDADADKLTAMGEDPGPVFDDFGPPDFADDECGECGGEGGYNSCLEDTCCAIGGEEGCDDPLCWRKCSACHGKGFFE